MKYSNSFSKQSKIIGQEELLTYLQLDLLKTAIATRYITCLFPTKNSKFNWEVPQISNRYDLKVNSLDEQINLLRDQFLLRYC